MQGHKYIGDQKLVTVNLIIRQFQKSIITNTNLDGSAAECLPVKPNFGNIQCSLVRYFTGNGKITCFHMFRYNCNRLFFMLIIIYFSKVRCLCFPLGGNIG